VSVLGAVYVVLQVLYNLYFHPLAKIPGPKLAAISGIPFLKSFAGGTSHLTALEWHRKYGDVVRIGPNELSFNTARAWKEIYATGRTRTFKKDRYAVSRPLKNGESGLAAAVDANHARQRRLMSYAFSEKALVQQESIIHHHIQSCLSYIKKTVQENKGLVDVANMYKYYTFDLISDLAFGESFNCLQQSDSRYLEQLADDAILQTLFLNTLRRLWIFRIFFPRFFPKSILEKPMQFIRESEEKLNRRLAAKTDRQDLIGHILLHTTDDVPMTAGELRANAKTFLSAGSTTTAAFLASTSHFLAQNPEKQEKLRNEIVASFASPEEISIVATARLPYLNAVIQEGLRIHPPIPAPLVREAHEATTVCDIPIAKEVST
jgi:cytochrome P450